MRAVFKHYEELAELIIFFRTWYGPAWERKTAFAAGCYRGEISGAQHGRNTFSKTLLPRLRALKQTLLT